MAYKITSPSIVPQNIADTSTTQMVPLGTIVRAVDPTYGEGEFIYLLGVANTVTGSVVRYYATTYQTTLITAVAVQVAPVAVAMSANVAAQYGWYQIEGLAVVKKTAVAVSPQVALYISGTAGRLKVIASAGLQIVGARSANLASVTSTTSTVIVLINRPHCQGQIT